MLCDNEYFDHPKLVVTAVDTTDKNSETQVMINNILVEIIFIFLGAELLYKGLCLSVYHHLFLFFFAQFPQIFNLQSIDAKTFILLVAQLTQIFIEVIEDADICIYINLFLN